MQRRWLLFLAVVVALGLSFLLRDVIQRVVILPLTYLWWLINLYYRTVPQFIVWVLLIIVVFISSLQLIPLVNLFNKVDEKDRKPARGPIEDLSQMLNKAPGGIYYKWLIANRLGNLARELLDQREGRRKRRFARLTGRDWQPPSEVNAYLESGLNGSFADFPQPHWWAEPRSTPLDLDAKQVVEYLEYEMEASHDKHRKGI